MARADEQFSVFIDASADEQSARQAVEEVLARVEGGYAHTFGRISYFPGFAYEVDLWGWTRESAEHVAAQLSKRLGVGVVGEWQVEELSGYEETRP